MTRKNLIFLSVIAILFFSRIAQAAMVTVKVGKATATPGRSIELPISVSNLAGLGIISVDLSLEYDVSLLSFSSLDTSQTILKDSVPPIYNSVPGLLKIAIFNPKALEGKGTLLKVTFNVNAASKAGKTKIVLRKVVFNDGKIGATLKNGMLKIKPLRQRHSRKASYKK